MLTTRREVTVDEFTELVEWEGGVRELYEHGLPDEEVPEVLREAWDNIGAAIGELQLAEIELTKLINKERTHA